MSRAVPATLRYHNVLRLAGIGAWLVLGIPAIDAAARRGYSLSGTHWDCWVSSFLIFGPAFWISSSLDVRSKRFRVPALVLQTVAVLVMTAIIQDYFVGVLLILASWQLAVFLSLRIASVWAAVQTILVLVLLQPHYYMGWRWAATGAYLAFQAFAFVAALMAKSEAAAREEQSHINAELVSTRELLAETARLGERSRLSRELHDALGHHLTALSLALEAAIHTKPEDASQLVNRARDISKQLLQEVRDTVSNMRDTDGIDVRSALDALADRLPGLRLHVDMPNDFRVEDQARAHAILRCVQEISTNTLKHAKASNLWIKIDRKGDALDITAWDDGRTTGIPTPGVGLSGMRERLEELGGGLAIDSASRSGLSLRAWMPLCERSRTA